METITLTKDGLWRIVNRTSGKTSDYKEDLINALFESQKRIREGSIVIDDIED